tara:strand:- start:6216 stop:6389 length:174 start_codon:yes stop_codon:yes gene_type:complete
MTDTNNDLMEKIKDLEAEIESAHYHINANSSDISSLMADVAMLSEKIVANEKNQDKG